MQLEEFILSVSKASGEDKTLSGMKKGLPLGVDGEGNIVLSQRRARTATTRHTCVTGAGKTEFLQRLLFTLVCLYEKREACFLILSPYKEYDAFLRLKRMDATVPYILQKSHFEAALKALKEVKEIRERGGREYARLFVVLDGVEELPDCNKNGDLEELRAVLELLAHREDVDVLCGVELIKSIFSGYPGAFVGVGNCLVTAEEGGKADVTYVEDDASLSLPITLEYPSQPSINNTVSLLNSIPDNNGEGIGI